MQLIEPDRTPTRLTIASYLELQDYEAELSQRDARIRHLENERDIRMFWWMVAFSAVAALTREIDAVRADNRRLREQNVQLRKRWSPGESGCHPDRRVA